MTVSEAPTIDNTPHIQASIRAYVMETFPACQQKGLDDSASLINSGIVDSMGILELLAFVESDFGILVEDTDLTPENFESIAAITAFVVSKNVSQKSQ